MKEKWKDEQTSCSEEKGELKWPKQKNYIEMWRQGVTVTNGGHRQNGEDVSASLHLRCSPLLRLLRTWGFAHNDATNQKEAADEKFQSSTQSTLTQLSWNVTHIQSRLFSSVSGSPPSSCRHFWGRGGREPVHTNPPTLHTPGGRELDEKAGYVTCSQVYTQSPWAYKGERFPKMPCHVIQSLLSVVLVSCDQNAISNQHLMEILIVFLNSLLYVPFMW